MSPARRVTVIAPELRGFQPAGGIGTATAFLALALVRLGHSVEILLGKQSVGSIDPYRETVYRKAGFRIRPAPQSDERVNPCHFAHAHSVQLGLRADPPDIVIAHDFGAPAYSALRVRQAGIAFEDTLFVVFCHGTRRYIADLSPNIAFGDLRTVIGVGVLEQASVELADVVVSPNADLVDWMRSRSWELPGRTVVIPYVTEPEAKGESTRGASSEAWAGVIDLQPQPRTGREDDADARVDVVVVRRDSQDALLRLVVALEDQSCRNFEVIVADTRQAGLDQGSAPYVVFLDEEDVPDPELLKTLLAAQRATGADVVTCGVRVDGELHFFSGDPGGLGAIANAYGNVGLFRRAVLGDVTDPPPAVHDSDWPLLARLAGSGASVVSVPIALVERRTKPGSAEDDPAAALLVVQQLEHALADPLRGCARLVAGLAADTRSR